jgi:hypothetical protein
MITKGCTSTSKLPVGLSWSSSVEVSKGTNSFVLSIVKVPSLKGIIFIRNFLLFLGRMERKAFHAANLRVFSLPPQH